MEFLNQSFAQLSDLFRSMTPGARITAALLLVLVATSLGYLFVYQVAGPGVDLMNGMAVPATQLPQMEAAFKKASLNGYEIRGSQIFVPRAQRSAYMAALVEAEALPPNISEVLERAVDKGSPFESSEQRQLRNKVALQAALGSIIGAMRDIERAVVLFSTEVGPGFPKTTTVRGTVTVWPNGDKQIEPSQARAISCLVAPAIGAKPEAISVVDGKSMRTIKAAGSDPDSDDDLYATRKRAYEQEWDAKIRKALEYVPNATVATEVELNRQRTQRKRTVKHDPKTVIYAERENSSTRSQDGGASGGRPGYASNAANTSATLASATAGTRQEEEQTQREQQGAVSGEQVDSEEVGLTPNLVRATVGIPMSYLKQVWAERNPAQAGQDPPKPDTAALEQMRVEVTDKLQKHVANLLPKSAAVKDPNELVTITCFQDITPPQVPAPGVGQHALAWLADSWGTLAVLGLAVVSLLMLRSLVRQGTPPAEPFAAPNIVPIESHGPEHAQSPETEAGLPAKGRTRGESSPIENLSALVKEDPDSAANILRMWIGNAG